MTTRRYLFWYQISCALLILGATVWPASAARLTGRITGLSPVHVIRFMTTHSSCQDGSGARNGEKTLEVRTDPMGRYAVEVEASTVWTMELELARGRRVSRDVPVLYDERLPPLRLPALRTQRIAVVDPSGQRLPGVDVRSVGATWEFGYHLEPTSCTTNDHGICGLALTKAESQALRVRGLPDPEVESAGGLLVLKVDDSSLGSKPEMSPSKMDASQAELSTEVTIEVTNEDGEPLPQALVWHLSKPNCYGKTNATGKAILSGGLPAGEVDMLVAAQGYEIRRLQELGSSTQFHLTLAAADGGIRAEVVDLDRKAIEDVVVEWPHAGRLAFTDEKGEVSFFGLRSNEWADLKLSKSGFSSQNRHELILRESDATTLKIRWKMYRPSTVHGRILDEQGEPAEDVEVTLSRRDTIPSAVDARGRFHIQDIPRGQQVLVFWRDNEPVAMVSFLAPGRGGDLNLGIVQVGSVVQLWGLVVDQDSRPVADADILVDLRPGRRPHRLMGIDGSSYYPALARTGSGGDFVIDGLAPGMEIGISAWKKGYATKEVLLVPEQLEESLTLHLRRLIPLDFRVVSSLDGQPIHDAVIFLSQGVPREGESDRLQGYHQRVLSSDYSGQVSSEVYPGGDGSCNVMVDGYVELTRSLRFPEDPGQELVLELDPAARLTGVVFGSAGQPLPKVSIQVKGVTGFKMTHDVTDSEGKYVLEGVPPGRVTLTLRAEGFVRQDKEVDVYAGVENRVDLIFEEPLKFRLSGHISTQDGMPPPRRMQIQAFDTASGIGYPGMTDTDGSFVFEELPRSRYRFRTWGDPFSIVGDNEVDLQTDVMDLRLIVHLGNDENTP